MKTFLLFILTASAIFALDGQAFLTTPDGGSQKLALVTVALFDRSFVDDFIAKKKEKSDPEESAAQNEAAMLDKSAAAARANDDYQKAHEYLLKSTQEIHNGMELYSAFFFDIPMADAVEHTKTDADGRFHFDATQTDSRDLVLVAFISVENQPAEDSARPQKTNYTWIVPKSEWEKPEFLTNENTFEINSFIPTKELLTSDPAARKAAQKKAEDTYYKN